MWSKDFCLPSKNKVTSNKLLFKASGHPPPRMSWTYSIKEEIVDDNIELSSNGTTITLTIVNFKDSYYDKRFYCHADRTDRRYGGDEKYLYFKKPGIHFI